MIESLHDIEKRILLTVRDNKMSIDEICKRSGLNIDQVRRGIEWLKYKDLVKVNEIIDKFIILDKKGLEAYEKGLPERRLINTLKEIKSISLERLKEISGLGEEFNAALSHAKNKGWIKIENGIVIFLNDDKKEDEIFIEKIRNGLPFDLLSKDEMPIYNALKRRPHYIKEEIVKSIEISLTQNALNILDKIDLSKRVLDLSAPTPTIYGGRKHPLQDIIDEIREVLIGLGFKEVDGKYIQNSFWNFDVLFTPQDHPARDMQDTFYIKCKIQNVNNAIEEDILNKVAKVHEEGWNYKLDREESSKLVLRTHTTSVTIRYLAENKPSEANVFSIGRVFRNEKLSYKHLAEFHQIEGIMVGNFTLRDLMGIQKEFYRRIGLEKVRFWPTYFPYTEPSLQSMVYSEKLGKWIELFGMGIFRPEVTRPIGINSIVLAWGGGLERIAMLKYGLEDVRELYTNRLSWLREVPLCQ